MLPLQTGLLLASSAAAGTINSVAGGGTLLTFPALLAAGQSATVANATSTVALWPGQIGNLIGLRREVSEGLDGSRTSVIALTAISIVGGAIGAYLLKLTRPEVFGHMVPYLILASVALFLAQEPISRALKKRAADKESDATAPDVLRMTAPIGAILFLIAIYGGYFGAGMGILILACLGVLGMRDIHRMNGVKAVFTLGANGAAALYFIKMGIVDWRTSGIMAAASIFGGYAGAGIARRLGQKNVRRIVVAVGMLLAAKLLLTTHS